MTEQVSVGSFKNMTRASAMQGRMGPEEWTCTHARIPGPGKREWIEDVVLATLALYAAALALPLDPAERIGGDVADPESQDAADIAAEHAANTCVRDLELAVWI